jgi:hypothetical protein
MKLILCTLFACFSLTAQAHLDDREVARVDAKREGQLAQKVLKQGKIALNTLECVGNNDPKNAADPVYKILKLEASSNHEFHTANYDYDASYLVTKLCMSGSTQGGAGLDFAGGVIMRAHFESRKPNQAKISVLKYFNRTDLPALF